MLTGCRLPPSVKVWSLRSSLFQSWSFRRFSGPKFLLPGQFSGRICGESKNALEFCSRRPAAVSNCGGIYGKKLVQRPLRSSPGNNAQVGRYVASQPEASARGATLLHRSLAHASGYDRTEPDSGVGIVIWVVPTIFSAPDGCPSGSSIKIAENSAIAPVSNCLNESCTRDDSSHLEFLRRPCRIA